MLFLLSAVSSAGAAPSGEMYAGDHWKYSRKLTTKNFDDEVKMHVDSGKTFFVRWIASEG